MTRLLAWWPILILVSIWCGRAEASTPTLDPFRPEKPLEAAREHALREGWLSEGAGREAVLYLITLYDGEERRQWLARISESALTDAELKAGWRDEVRHTTTGRRLVFPRRPRALQIDFVGPFAAGAATAGHRHTTRRVLVAHENLSTGFVSFARGALELRTRIEASGVTLSPYWIMRRPLAANVVAEGRRQAETIRMTEEDERRTCAVLFALMAMYEAASEVGAFKEVLERVLDKPTLWAVMRSGGLNATITFPWHGFGIEASDATTPVRAFRLPVQLNFNSVCALRAWLAVTEPNSPLDLVGGIQGAWAEHPRLPGKRLHFGLMSSGRN